MIILSVKNISIHFVLIIYLSLSKSILSQFCTKIIILLSFICCRQKPCTSFMCESRLQWAMGFQLLDLFSYSQETRGPENQKQNLNHSYIHIQHSIIHPSIHLHRRISFQTTSWFCNYNLYRETNTQHIITIIVKDEENFLTLKHEKNHFHHSVGGTNAHVLDQNALLWILMENIVPFAGCSNIKAIENIALHLLKVR